ncbi:nuclear autoantigen Sp-100 isoform X2 [Desmodus rotundus]|nr:nuclear autoantigen Sp-100 isoform X2 [Desmodus rotundus]XP_053775163.1 nuclear autoantigen Sp-100 isoform X2 [Desmodus rotundus]XP_053775164.1 nuclear autoantigen Sp-100 isoform X2 [Desmodus rotundus]XP_053775165.1 nuclear autoantigen Sp-100 isoform X2 [Desmodus rotundus]XP_053775166.1 nuclear autoantigen Sp-100 isoform X2 [Desmodus rotundus]
MCSVVQNKKMIFRNALLNHFKENKVEIANAITKPFPFLESLRDRSFITEEMYNESQEACGNLVPVGKVVYRILCQLEKTFDRSLLHALFSGAHLKEYPDLIQIQRSFENVIQDKFICWESDREETHKMPSTQPPCEEGAECSTYDHVVQPCAVGLVSCHPKMNEEGQRARPACDQASEIIESSNESSVEEAPQEVQSSASRCEPGEDGEDSQPGTRLDETVCSPVKDPQNCGNTLLGNVGGKALYMEHACLYTEIRVETIARLQCLNDRPGSL